MRVLDTNGDGVITAMDYKLVMLRYKHMNASKEQLQKVEEALTEMYRAAGIVDDTTALTYEEFGANFAKSIERGEDFDKVFSTQFDIVDTDKNGEISYKEWADYYGAAGINVEFAKASFDAMDTNKDGVVSKEEFMAYVKEYYCSAEDKLKSSILYGPILK